MSNLNVGEPHGSATQGRGLDELWANDPFAMLVLDRHFRLKRYTPAAALLMGLGPEDINQPVTSLRAPGGDLLAEARQALDRSSSLEREVSASDGTRYLRRVQPYRRSGARIDGVLIAFADITEVMRASDAAHRAAEALQAEPDKNELLAMLGHELRNPLAAIHAAAEVLQQPVVTESQAKWAVAVVHRQALHLSRLIHDLLDVSRVMRGEMEIRKEIVPVSQVVERAVEMCRPMIDERRQQLTVSLPAEPVFLQGDPARLIQILENLLSNASKYTQRAGLIDVQVSVRNRHLVFRITDNGIGMSPELLSRVFDLFRQGERTLDRAQGGLGIGLTLVRRFAEMHEGTVEARSDGPGRGSTFTVTLPAHSVQTEEKEVEDREQERHSNWRRVLVVDDNRDSAEGLAAILSRKACECRVAFDGLSALKIAKVFRPHVVLLDIGLPEMDGYAVARELRAMPQTCRSLLIAVSGYGQEEDVRRSQEAGMDHHVTKPVDLAALTELMSL